MINTYRHINRGTCSQSVTISYDTDTHIIQKVAFEFGCPGNTVGVAKLCEGRKLEEVRDILKGTTCGRKPTSCPDQLALAIEDILNASN